MSPAPATTLSRRRPPDASGLDLRPGGLRLAQAAGVVGVLFAAVSAYWAVGGGRLLDTLGGSLERQARAGDAGTVLVLLTTAVAKLVAVLLPLLAVGRLRRPAWRRWRRAPRTLAWVEAAVMTTYGLLYTTVGSLALAGVLRTSAPVNRRAMAWHAFLWDPWFLVWGLLVGAALLCSSPARPARTRSVS